ncbi:MAG: DUF2752 domain-containing protein [Clostridia bacterium]|nr:DUF2752 domain-containing protein [Clostridia bacterium]
MKEKIKRIFKKYWLPVAVIILISPFYFTLGCPFRFFGGFSCFGCGMSRAAEALLHFDFLTAFQMHPLIYIMPIAVVLFLVRNKLPERLKNILVAAFCISFVGVYFFRLFSGSEIVFIDLKSGFVYRCIEHVINLIK